MNNPAIDQYLARTLASIIHAGEVPAWPAELGGCEAAAARRIAFHGIALSIARAPGVLACWPEPLAHAVREQAGIQTFWEQSHRPAIVRLLEAFAAAGIRAIVTKGTALAYSVYDDPALRRRGDTDIYVPGASQRMVREVLQTCGFQPEGDTKALQESWVASTAIGFTPAVDMHWRINASAAVSRVLEAGLRFDQSIKLERLSPHAIGIGPVDNLILIAINRNAHGKFGYRSGSDLIFETDRLAWALDAHLLAASFSADDWVALADRAGRTGTTDLVQGTLAFATRILGTRVPEETVTALQCAPAHGGLASYFGASSHLWRLRQDMAAGRNIAEKAQVLRYTVFPSDEFLLSRFPDADRWPRPALHLRRFIEGAGKLLSGRI
jgi:hypothetical protein